MCAVTSINNVYLVLIEECQRRILSMENADNFFLNRHQTWRLSLQSCLFLDFHRIQRMENVHLSQPNQIVFWNSNLFISIRVRIRFYGMKHTTHKHNRPSLVPIDGYIVQPNWKCDKLTISQLSIVKLSVVMNAWYWLIYRSVTGERRYSVCRLQSMRATAVQFILFPLFHFPIRSRCGGH